MAIKERIRMQRILMNMTLEEVAERVGVTRATIQKYESGAISNIPQEKIEMLAKALGTTPGYLMGWEEPKSFAEIMAEDNGLEYAAKLLKDLRQKGKLPSNVTPLPTMDQVPLVGRIACGVPILAEENIEEYVDLPNHIRADFALTCQGESMINIGIHSGDIVYIRQQEEVENGQVAAVMVGEEEATLKRFYHTGDVVQLTAENSAVPPMVFVGEEAAQVRVLGLAVAYTHSIE